jgi:hypothetical protein
MCIDALHTFFQLCQAPVLCCAVLCCAAGALQFEFDFLQFELSSVGCCLYQMPVLCCAVLCCAVLCCALLCCAAFGLQDEARARAEAQAKAKEDQRRKQEEARAAAAAAAQKKQVSHTLLSPCPYVSISTLGST